MISTKFLTHRVSLQSSQPYFQKIFVLPKITQQSYFFSTEVWGSIAPGSILFMQLTLGWFSSVSLFPTILPCGHSTQVFIARWAGDYKTHSVRMCVCVCVTFLKRAVHHTGCFSLAFSMFYGPYCLCLFI